MRVQTKIGLSVCASAILLACLVGGTACRRKGSEMTPLGRAVLKGHTGSWTRVDNDHFRVWTDQEIDADHVLKKAEFARQRVTQQLSLAGTTRKANLFILSDPAVWAKLRWRRGWRLDGRALQYRGDFVILMADADALLRDDITHEVVHWLIQEAYEDSLPLALEEGLAMNLGWKATLSYHLLNDQILTRSLPSLDANALWYLKDLVALETYPADTERAKCFYRQSESWVEAIIGKIGGDRLGEFVERMSEKGAQWDDILRNSFECSDDDIRGIRRSTELSLYRE